MTLEQQRTAAAQALAAVGFQILEMLEGHKEPLGAAWQTLGMSDPDDIARVLARPGRQYGVYPPPGSRLLIADVDRPEVLADFPPLPPTLIVDTARGFHVYARLPDGVEEEDVPRTFAGGEVRIAGSGQVVGPWSLHPSGSLYTPRNGADVGELTADWMAALRRSHQVMNAAWRAAQGLEDAGWYIEHGRHEFLVGRARLMRGHGLTGERLRDELLRLDKERCRPPIATLPGRGVAEDRWHCDLDRGSHR